MCFPAEKTSGVRRIGVSPYCKWPGTNIVIRKNLADKTTFIATCPTRPPRTAQLFLARRMQSLRWRFHAAFIPSGHPNAPDHSAAIRKTLLDECRLTHETNRLKFLHHSVPFSGSKDSLATASSCRRHSQAPSACRILVGRPGSVAPCYKD